MRTFIVFILLVFVCNVLRAQSNAKFNMGVGYGLGTHITNDGLNFVIGRYNDTRPYLSKPMDEVHFFRGWNVAVETYFPKFLMEFEFIGHTSNVSAESSSTSDARDFKYRMNTFNMGYAYQLTGQKDKVQGLYGGFDISTISVKNFTRTYTIGNDPGDFYEINWDLIIGVSPYLQYAGGRFTFKGYYQWMIFKQNFWDVNVALNPATWSGDAYESNEGKANTIGMVLRVNLWENDRPKSYY
ncbi:MAG TPA: hypothetical protein PKK72_13650 [Chitinophagales bacterium]|nr:hypothetical protein [Chitinophagales bacterium]HMU69368.1 hypothetical protein [Chitinophagales bacterium]HMX05578.1 hypothetical protein [Chitinophagales bacterium]HMZ89708.1 hypothetical protein [Chitinophagales bacterium]HNJ90269.1 hypothetical protein [Chitinophagales bacterium]